MFRQLLVASSPEYIECHSNDLLLSSMLFEFSASVKSEILLFEDGAVTEHILSGASV